MAMDGEGERDGEEEAEVDGVSVGFVGFIREREAMSRSIKTSLDFVVSSLLVGMAWTG
jgi:hypothetical protein